MTASSNSARKVSNRTIGRRDFLRQAAAFSAAGLLPSIARSETVADPLRGDALLQEVARRACLYFWEQASAKTGLVRDRARMSGREDRRVASIAATGFGLSALCISDQQRYAPRGEAQRRAEMTMRFLASAAPHHRGFYYHFLDMETGERAWQSELSSIDTAWLLCGVLHARTYFDTPAIWDLATEILDRVDWQWMLNGKDTLSHGWTPERGFLPYRWDSYSELLAMYLLAIGSLTFPIPATCWDAWHRPEQKFDNLTYIDAPAPLFVHQYSHAWFDFSRRRDKYTDYFENSRRATEAHRRFCIGLAQRYPWYGEDMWGVTACDSRQGYKVWDSLNPANQIDGTLVPCASGGSIPFLPAECKTVLETMLSRYGKNVWGRYGFVDAFHPRDEWYSPDVLGIDQGIMLLMAENARTRSVWNAVMGTPEALRGMNAVGLVIRL